MIRVVLAVSLALATPAFAQMVKSEITVSNGTVVSVNSDDFAGRYEYTAPTIRFDNRNGFALVAAIKEGGEVEAIIYFT